MKRWRTALWALLLILPGGLWILGGLALVNAVRRALQAEASVAVPPPGPPAEDLEGQRWVLLERADEAG